VVRRVFQQYLKKRDAPEAITVCVNPLYGRASLSELPLPVAPNENYLSELAITKPDARIASIKAEVTVSFCLEGLQIAGEEWQRPPPAAMRKIAAIMEVLMAKSQSNDSSNVVRRSLPVRERDK
jgi:hypothetical protein